MRDKCLKKKHTDWKILGLEHACTYPEGPEQLIKRAWEQRGLLPLVARFDRAFFSVIAPADGTRWKTGGLRVVPELGPGARLKYAAECEAALDTCHRAEEPPRRPGGPARDALRRQLRAAVFAEALFSMGEKVLRTGFVAKALNSLRSGAVVTL
jgi:hypothetical protein